MNNFKDFNLEQEKQDVINSVLQAKKLLEKEPFNFKWHFNDAEVVDIVERELYNPRGINIVLANSEIKRNIYTKHNNVYTATIFISDASDRDIVPGSNIMFVVSYPKLRIFDITKNRYYMRNNLQDYKERSDFSYIFEVEERDRSFFLGLLNERRAIKTSILSFTSEFKVAKRISEMSNVIHMDEVIDVLEYAGLPRTDVIRLKIKHGVELDDDEMNDETLAGIV